MKRLGFPRALMLAVLACATASAADPPAGQKWNVLFLVADDLNCDLGCYGHPRVQVAEHRRAWPRAACGSSGPTASSRCATRAARRSSPAGARTPRRFSPTPAGRFSTDYTGTPHFREIIPDAVTLPQLFQQQRLLRGPRRQAVSLRRAGADRHRRPRRSAVAGSYVVNPRGRDKDEENQDLHAHARQLRRHAELARGRRRRRRADRRHRAATARSGCWSSTRTSRSSWPSASTGRTRRTSRRRSTSSCTRRKRHHAAGALRRRQERACRPPPTPSAKPEQETMTDEQRREAIAGVLRLDHVHGCAGRPRARRARPARSWPTRRSSSSPATTATTSASTACGRR